MVMAAKLNDPTTRFANGLSAVAELLVGVGLIGFLVGLIGLFDSGAGSFAFLVAGGFCGMTGALMMTIQSATMLVIREMWEIERARQNG